MSEYQTNWTKEELHIYILIYCANADFHEDKVEIDYIKSHLNADAYDRLHDEFMADSDYQTAQKIRTTLERHHYSKDEFQQIIEEMKGLFMSDGKEDILERNLLVSLKHLMD